MQEQNTGRLGLLAVILFFVALLIFGIINDEFHFFSSYISLLGAKGQPYALLWNMIGFGLVGILLMAFGFNYGKVLKDKIVQFLLPLFGLGFALTSFPMDMQNDRSPVSKAHIVAICMGLACWLISLSRLNHSKNLPKKVQRRAGVAAILLACSMIGGALNLWSMPLTHRLVFSVVFGWNFITSFELIKAPSNI